MLPLPLRQWPATILAAIIFFALITPVGLVRRLFGKPSIELRLEPSRSSYWRQRDRPGALRDQY